MITSESETIILIDCDGVLANFDKMFIGIVRDVFGIDFDPSGSQEWDYFNHPEVKAIKDQVWKHILGTPGTIYELEKYSYTDDLLAKLREVGHVECVTSIVSGGTYADERLMWLIDKAGFQRDDIHLSYRKYRIEGDVFIDDKPDNVIKWFDSWGTEYLPVMWNTPGRTPFTIDEVNKPHILQTGNVNDLIQAIKEIK